MEGTGTAPGFKRSNRRHPKGGRVRVCVNLVRDPHAPGRIRRLQIRAQRFAKAIRYSYRDARLILLYCPDIVERIKAGPAPGEQPLRPDIQVRSSHRRQAEHLACQVHVELETFEWDNAIGIFRGVT